MVLFLQQEVDSMLLLAAIQVVKIMKMLQGTKKNLRGALTFSGGTAPECPPRGYGPDDQ